MYSNSTEWATTMTNKICITIAPPFDERRPVALHKRVAEIHRLEGIGRQVKAVAITLQGLRCIPWSNSSLVFLGKLPDIGQS
jgi:hypothetical protein